MAMSKRKNDHSSYVYSTNPDFSFEEDNNDAAETPQPEKQLLYVSHDRKMRKGKVVTLVEGFIGSEDDLTTLGRVLKNKCGVGGSAKDGEIILQGELREKVVALLEADGYKVKRKGG